MTTHLSFHDDALEEFIAAFAIHQQLTAGAQQTGDLRTAVNGVRSLTLALEKGCKDALARIDPYLVLTKPDRGLLLQLRKDMNARPVPTIFCSRHVFETLSANVAWETLRDLNESTLAPDAVSSFDQGFRRLVDFRNRAMHGEIFAEPAELVAVMDEVLARFGAIMRTANPEWFQALVKRNGQLESRLKGIEDKVDANWQVLVDYLERFGRIKFPLHLHAWIEVGARVVETLFGNSGEADNMLGQAHVSMDATSGLFASFLTKEQASARYDARRRPSRARSEQADLLRALGAPGEPVLLVEKPLVHRM